MLNGLVTVRILAHVGDLHFPDFVNHASIVAFVVNRRNGEDRVQLSHEFLPPAHQIDQPLHVM